VKNTTILTGTDHLLRYADNIIILRDGNIADAGSREEIFARCPEVVTHLENENESGAAQTSPSEVLPAKERVEKLACPDKDADPARKKSGWGVYSYYLKSAGYMPFAFFIFFTVTESVTSNFSGESGTITVTDQTKLTCSSKQYGSKGGLMIMKRAQIRCLGCTLGFMLFYLWQLRYPLSPLVGLSSSESRSLD
jgi:hypothetical protein